MKLKSAGIFPLFAIVIFYSSAWCEKLVEVVSPIIKLHVDPSATSDTKGFARKGQRFIVNGESGPWYQIRLYNTIVWIPKEAVNVLESTEPAPVAAAPAAPAAGNANAKLAAQPAHPAAPPPVAQQTAPAVPASQETQGPAPAGTTPAPGAPGLAAAPGVAGAAPAPKPKKLFKPPRKGTWYTQFSHISEEESGKEISFFQIASNEAAVYSSANTAAAVLMKAKKGDFFPLLEESGVWYKIALKDTVGWIEADKGSIVNAPSSGFFEEYQLYIIIGASIAVLIIAAILLIIFRRRANIKGRKTDPFRAMIFAKSSVSIRCIVSNKTMSLEKYLGAIGFSVKTVRMLDGAQKTITKLQPEVVFIDWDITDDIPGTIEILFAGYDENKLPLAVFFNLPDLSDIPMIPVLLRAYHLGRSFSDHDISKLITPTMLSRTTQKATAAAALEGDIAEGNLPEIMQFIETGKKTGCLLIETDLPLGMIYFGQGRIIHAAAANNVMGREAISFLLDLKQGKFKFLLNKEPKTSDLNLSTLEVLMEWSKAEDEAHRS
ncbi:MAG: DUF4388 domain-containing protein [Chitinispirillaceae bacterium]|jgi:hypothetical protein